MPMPTDAQIFELGDFTLQSGVTLRDARLAYKTFGKLNDDKSNVVVYPTWYSGWHTDNEWLVGPTRRHSIRTNGSSSFPTCSETDCRRRRRMLRCPTTTPGFRS